jgi:hypothetical protein
MIQNRFRQGVGGTSRFSGGLAEPPLQVASLEKAAVSQQQFRIGVKNRLCGKVSPERPQSAFFLLFP